MAARTLFAVAVAVWIGISSSLAEPSFAQGATARAGSACTQQTFENNHFTVCGFDTHKQAILLAWTDARGEALRAFRRLQAQLPGSSQSIRFAMNAGMFDTNGKPIGLYVDHGRELVPVNTKSGTGNFYLKPNGVFWVDEDGALGVTATERFASQKHRLVWATQSGPLLVADGTLNPQISPDGASKLIRNGVGIHDAHRAYFVISNDPVSFGALARFFRDSLGCPNALYFDGIVSSLWVPSLGRRDEAYDLGPMVVVLDR